MLEPGHSLIIQRFDMSSSKLMESEVTFQLGWEKMGMLRIEGVLWDRTHGRHGLKVFFLQVQVTQADRQAGVFGFSS